MIRTVFVTVFTLGKEEGNQGYRKVQGITIVFMKFYFIPKTNKELKRIQHNVDFWFCWTSAYILYGLPFFPLDTALTAQGSQDG